MKPRQLKKRMQRAFDEGHARSSLFGMYRNQGVPDKKVAYLASTLRDKALCEQHRGKRNVLIRIAAFFAIVTAVYGYVTWTEHGTTPVLVVMAVSSCISLVFLYGFYRFRLWSYLAYTLLAITQLARQFEGFTEAPFIVLAGVSISVLIIAFVWYTKTKVYPCFGVFGPRKEFVAVLPQSETGRTLAH